ncbi:MAG: hypothetical protein FK730_14245 [Asgard group archaeon]|nr:hypothetical protein [Asgard group archaeon]
MKKREFHIYFLLIYFIVMLIVPLFILSVRSITIPNYEFRKWAIVTDHAGYELLYMPNNESWESIKRFEGKSGFIRFYLRGKIEAYDNEWGFRFISEKSEFYTMLACVHIMPELDFNYVSERLSRYLGEYIQVEIKGIEAFDIITISGLKINKFDNECFSMIIITEILSTILLFKLVLPRIKHRLLMNN